MFLSGGSGYLGGSYNNNYGVVSIQPFGGKVGIGTTVPAFALDVVGDINSSTAIKVGGNNILDEAVRLAIAFG